MAEQNCVEEIKCDDCERYLSVSPVFAKANGKSICSSCKNNNPMAPRNETFEAVAKYIKFPCQFKNAGCRMILAWEEAKVHETECEYQNFNCFMDDCDWIGKISALEQHYEEKHSEFLLNLPGVLQPDISINSDKKYICSSFDYLFIVHVKYTVSTSVLSYYICFLGKTDFASKFEYGVEITSGQNTIMLKKTVQPMNELYSLENHNRIELKFNALLSTGIITKYDDCEIHLFVKIIQNKCSNCELELTSVSMSDDELVCRSCQITKCDKCGSTNFKSDPIHNHWFCNANPFKCCKENYSTVTRFEHCLKSHVKQQINANVVTLRSVPADTYKWVACSCYNSIFLFKLYFNTKINNFVYLVVCDIPHYVLDKFEITYQLSNPQTGYTLPEIIMEANKTEHYEYEWCGAKANDIENSFINKYFSGSSVITCYNIKITIKMNKDKP